MSGGAIKSVIIELATHQLPKKLHNTVNGKFENSKLYSSFKDNIWGDYLVGMQLINKFSKKIRYLLCVIDIYSKCAWIIPLKDKESVTITNVSQKI